MNVELKNKNKFKLKKKWRFWRKFKKLLLSYIKKK